MWDLGSLHRDGRTPGEVCPGISQSSAPPGMAPRSPCSPENPREAPALPLPVPILLSPPFPSPPGPGSASPRLGAVN